MLLVLLAPKNMVFRVTMRLLLFGKRFLLKLASKRRLLRLILQRMVTSVVSRKVNASSSITTRKTGGLVVVVLRRRQSAIHVAQILRSSMILAKISRMSKNMARVIQHLTVLALWKLVIRSLCSIVVKKTVVLKSLSRRMLTLVLVLSV